MSGFFGNLIDRHLGVCETVQPRIPGRFEMDQTTGVELSSSEVGHPAESELNGSRHGEDWPSPQPASEAARQWSQESGPEVNHRESMASNRYPPADPAGVFSIEAAETAVHEPDSAGGNGFSPSSFLKVGASSPRSGMTGQPATPPGFVEPEGSQRLDLDAGQWSQPVNRALFSDEHPPLRNEVARRGRYEQDEITTANRSALPQSVDKQYLEQRLNQPVGAVLQQQADSPPLSATETAPDGYRDDRDERLAAVQAENGLRLDVTHSPEVMPATEPPASAVESQPDSGSDHLQQSEKQHQLEVPAWLSEMTARLNSHSQQHEAKTEPVINVTIGRVEVRAIQSETVKSASPPKRASGVMTLDEYLQRRKGQTR